MRRLTLIALISLFSGGLLQGHETFLRPESHTQIPGKAFEVVVFTGNFDRSVFPMNEASIETLELHSLGNNSSISTSDWKTINSGSKFWGTKQRVTAKLGGTDLRDTASFTLTIKKAGTHLIGVEFSQARIALDVPKFNKYLEGEAYLDLDIAELGFTDPSDVIVEGYTKIAKTIVQVGDVITENATKPIGHIVEIVPLVNPSKVKIGNTLDLQILHKGLPIADQSVVIGWKPGAFKRSMDTIVVYKSNNEGVISLPITQSGIWWANFILIKHTPENEELDFASLWSSLTFNIQ